jgi:hypothetical protein
MSPAEAEQLASFNAVTVNVLVLIGETLKV